MSRHKYVIAGWLAVALSLAGCTVDSRPNPTPAQLPALIHACSQLAPKAQETCVNNVFGHFE